MAPRCSTLGCGGTQWWPLLELARMEPGQAERFAGATLTVHYEELGVEHQARITSPRGV
jgi:hypothetical protein